MCRRQVAATETYLRVDANHLQSVVDLVAVNKKLVLTPSFSFIAQDVDKVLPRFRGKFEWQRLTERHLDLSAVRYAWH